MKNEYLGYHDVNSLPIQAGDEVTITKGTLYKHRGELREARRAKKVRISHVLCGMSECVGHYHNGVVSLYITDRHTLARVQKRYGTTPLTELWPIMSVRDGSIFIPVQNPEIVWAGSGGYWSEADINQFV